MHRSYRTPALLGAALLLMLLAAPRAQAGGIDLTDKLAAHVEETVRQVKAADDPAEKRRLLDHSFTDLAKALRHIERLPRLSDENHRTVDALQAEVQTYHHRLSGTNGYERVPDAQLNQLADQAQQGLDMQNRTITLSITSVLLILILLVLLL